MTSITRLPLAVAMLGAGLVLLAVGAGAPLALLLAFAGAGVAHLVWAVVLLRVDSVPAPRLLAATALAPLALWAAAIAAGGAAQLPLGPLAAASVLGLACALVVVTGLRRAHGATRTATGVNTDGVHTDGANTDGVSGPTDEHPWRVIATIAASAAIVAGIVTPALAGTWAGQYAEPHGSHDIPGLEVEEHGGH
jgi:hypothetical protein